MRLSRLTLLALIVALIVALIAAGCAAPAPAPTPSGPATVRIGIQPWIGYGPWWIAQEKGMFEAAGIKAEFVDFVTDSEVNAAFAAGEMDVANLATHTSMKLFANGVDLQVVLLEDVSYDADAILAGEGIATVKDLAGKSVAYEEGATSDLLLNAALRENDMTLEDITPVPMPAADAGSALIAGQVDAAVTYEPYIAAALGQDPSLKIIYSGKDVPGLISDVLATPTTWANDNEDTLKSLLKVWGAAVDYFRGNPEEGKAIIAKAVGSTPEELESAFEGIAFYDLSENVEQLSVDGGMMEMANVIAQSAISMGILEEAPDFLRMVNPNYLMTE